MTKIKIIDTHCHLYSGKLIDRIEEVTNHALASGVEKIYMPNVDSKSINDMLELESRFPFCRAMMGLHPCSVNLDYKDELKIIDEWFNKRAFVGVGETGIDLYWDKTYYEEQVKCFQYQIDLSIDIGIPIIIHSRDSLDITIDIISKRQNGKLTGVFHCYNGTIDQTKKIVDSGFYMGLGGVITYKNSNLDDMIKYMPMGNMVLETDSPYLSPVPQRGKENEPAYLTYVLDKICEIRNVSKEEVASSTSINAQKLFREEF
jgi:TatD DNase family protein